MKEQSIVAVVKGIVSEMEDPRVVGRILHSLVDILVIALCGVLSGGESWEEIVDHAEDRKEWFSSFLELRHGIPSHDTIERLFQRPLPEELHRLLEGISGVLQETLSGEIVSIDGKSLRGSFDRLLNQKMKHVVSAYVGESGVTIAQVTVS